MKRAMLILLLAGITVVRSEDSLSAEESANDGKIRIQVTAVHQSTLSGEISARIAELPFREGEWFSSGDLLVGFDCALLQAQLRKSEATAEAARQTLLVNEKLDRLNAIGALEVELTRAKVNETVAEVEATKVLVSKCSIRAPFSGRVARRYVDLYDYMTPGKPLMDILDTGTLEVRLLVPSRWLSWLKPKSRFSVMIEELGKSYPAQVALTGARIDPLSQTVGITGEFIGRHPELLPGMSGWATFRMRR